MNVHHLELFYYVARHGGVSAAARHMPYGIQQPAISAQILQLEDSLGVTLFHRRPFKLTREGTQLYQYIEPFFGGLKELAEKLRGGAETRLRIATPEIVQLEYLPVLLKRLRRKVTGFHFALHSGRSQDIESLLQAQEIDVGLSTLIGKRGDGIRHTLLVSMPMVLLVPQQSDITSAEQIWKMDRIKLPLVTLPNAEPVCKLFQEELQKRKVEWIPSLEVGSLDLVNRYVAEGFGVGLSLAAPISHWPKSVRALPLNEFPSVAFGALWMGNLSALGKAFIAEAEALATELFNLAKAKPAKDR